MPEAIQSLNTSRHMLFRSGAAALSLGVVLSQAACSAESQPMPDISITKETLSPVPSVSTELNLGERVLREVVPCVNVRPESSLGKRLFAEKVVVVDGRCDANPDQPVGIYIDPTQSSQALGVATNGQELKVLGTEQGDPIQAVRNAASDVWVQVEFEGQEGVIPAVWVQGEPR